MSINIGIVGSGQLAHLHVEALEKASAKVVATAEVNEAAGTRLAARTGAKNVGSCQRLLDDPMIEVVLVATPNHLHYQTAADALDAGKDVFCEKPMTTQHEHAVDLVETVRQHPSQTFQVGYMKRYNPGFRLVEELLPRIGPAATAHVHVLITYQEIMGSSWYQRPS